MPSLGLHGESVPLSELVRRLTSLSGAIVEDGTGLTGLFDLSTTGWKEMDGYHDDLPDLSTMLETQLGLTLKRGKKSVDVIVIDHVEKPTRIDPP